jgi:hypothetical protein
LAEQILHREVKPPRQVDDRIPRRLEEICSRCLSKDIGTRYRTAGDLADDLRAMPPRRSRFSHGAGAATAAAMAAFFVAGWQLLMATWPPEPVSPGSHSKPASIMQPPRFPDARRVELKGSQTFSAREETAAFAPADVYQIVPDDSGQIVVTVEPQDAFAALVMLRDGQRDADADGRPDAVDSHATDTPEGAACIRYPVRAGGSYFISIRPKTGEPGGRYVLSVRNPCPGNAVASRRRLPARR